MTNNEIINKVKEQVALNHGYPDNILGTSWEYAMYLTHRTKRQLELYDEVIMRIVSIEHDAITYIKNTKLK